MLLKASGAAERPEAVSDAVPRKSALKDTLVVVNNNRSRSYAM